MKLSNLLSVKESELITGIRVKAVIKESIKKEMLAECRVRFTNQLSAAISRNISQIEDIPSVFASWNSTKKDHREQMAKYNRLKISPVEFNTYRRGNMYVSFTTREQIVDVAMKVVELELEHYNYDCETERMDTTIFLHDYNEIALFYDLYDYSDFRRVSNEALGTSATPVFSCDPDFDEEADMLDQYDNFRFHEQCLADAISDCDKNSGYRFECTDTNGKHSFECSGDVVEDTYYKLTYKYRTKNVLLVEKY